MSSFKDLSDTRVLITGISGFVGPHLASSLVNQGGRVFGLVRRRSDGNIWRGVEELGLKDKISLIEGSVEDLTSLLNAIDKVEPDYVFHLAAQSFVERPFINPLETFHTNATGTTNMLEALRIKDKIDAKFIFAGSSEEYGLVFSTEKQLNSFLKRGRRIFPEPKRIPELPITEDNPLRPLSPYAVSKVFGDFITRNYHTSYGMKTIVTRAFNHEGARRGVMFVTSTITKQVVQLKYGEIQRILIGNLNAFRDWSHVEDIVEGYVKVAQKGIPGSVYNLGSERTNSVLTYLLWSLEQAGFKVNSLQTIHGSKQVKEPALAVTINRFGKSFKASQVDELMLEDKLNFEAEDRGLIVESSRGKITVEFDSNRFRPADVPILLSDITKASNELGFKPKREIVQIIREQLNYFEDPQRRLAH
jgi:GDP-mannose 4,6-dehydratase